MKESREGEGAPPITNQQMDAILPLLDRFEALCFSARSWKMPKGQFPWFNFNETVWAFNQALYDNGWVTPEFN